MGEGVVEMAVSTVLADVVTAMSSALSIVEAHPVLAVFLGFSVVGGAIGAFSTIKGAVR